MTSLNKVRTEIILYSFFCGIVAVGFTSVVFAILSVYTAWDRALCLAIAGLVGVFFAAIGSLLIARCALTPLKALQQTILHISAGNNETPAVKLDDVHVGQDLVSSLSTEIYKLAGGYNLQDTTRKDRKSIKEN